MVDAAGVVGLPQRREMSGRGQLQLSAGYGQVTVGDAIEEGRKRVAKLRNDVQESA